MSFNKKQNSIKKIITADSISRAGNLKEKFLRKEGMALHRGQSYLRNSSLNVKLQRYDYSGRVQQIKQEIEQMFEPILRERVNVDGKGKLVKINPGVENIQVKDIDPGSQGFGDIGTQGVSPGCIYFRYGFKRTILPADDTEAGQEAREMFGDLQNVIGQIEPNFNVDKFLNDLQSTSVVPLPPFNTAHVSSQSSEAFINELAGTMRPNDPGYKAIQSLVQRNKRFHDIFGTRAAAMPSGNTHMRFKFDATLADPENDVLSPSIANMKNEFSLVRAIQYKIQKGYGLDKRGLEQAILEKHHDKQREEQEAAGLPWSKGNSQQFFKLWRSRWRGMMDLYKAIQGKSEKSQAIDEKIREEISKPAPARDENKLDRLYSRLGMEVQQEAPFDYFQAQLLLQYLTVPSAGTDDSIGPNEVMDPDFPTSIVGDGWSTHPAVNRLRVARDRGHNIDDFVNVPYTPPFNRVEGPEATNVRGLDFEGVNFGLRHLASTGDGATQILKQYGPLAKKIVTALQTVDPNTIQNENLRKILTDYRTVFLGAETLHQFLNSVNNPDQLASQIDNIAQQDPRGMVLKSSFNPHQKIGNVSAFEYLKQFGYSLSKLMDICYACVHTSDKQEFEVQSKNGANSEGYTNYGRGISVGSAVGQGGEILLSVRYAGRAKIGDFFGSENTQDVWQQEWRENQPKDPRPGADFPPVGQTQHIPGAGANQTNQFVNEQQPMQPGQNGANIHYVSNLNYFLGQKSSVSQEGVTDSMFHTIATGSKWHLVQSQLAKMYSVGDQTIAQANGDYISEMGADLQKFEAAIIEAIQSTRDKVSKELTIEIKTGEGESEVIPAGGNSQIATEEKTKAKERKPRIPKVPGIPKTETPVPQSTPAEAPVPVPQMPTTTVSPTAGRDPNEPVPLEMFPQHDVNRSMQRYKNPQTVAADLTRRYEIRAKQELQKTKGEMAETIFADPTQRREVLINYLQKIKSPTPGTTTVAPVSVPTPQPANLPEPTPVGVTQEPNAAVRKPMGNKSMFRKVDPSGKIQRSSVEHDVKIAEDKKLSDNVEEKIVKTANMCDEAGISILADKLDLLLTKVAAME